MAGILAGLVLGVAIVVFGFRRQPFDALILPGLRKRREMAKAMFGGNRNALDWSVRNTRLAYKLVGGFIIVLALSGFFAR